MKYKDRIAGILFAVFGVVVTLMATQIRIQPNLSEPGPRLFPYIAGIGMAVCGVGIALTEKGKHDEPYLTKEGWKRLGVVSFVLVLYYFGLEYLGFLIATPVFTFAIILILASGIKLSKVVTAVIALATTGGLYLLFQKAFMIFLPSGKLF